MDVDRRLSDLAAAEEILRGNTACLHSEPVALALALDPRVLLALLAQPMTLPFPGDSRIGEQAKTVTRFRTNQLIQSYAFTLGLTFKIVGHHFQNRPICRNLRLHQHG